MKYLDNKSLNSLKKGFSLIEIMIVIMIGGIIMVGAFGAIRWLGQAKVQTTNQKLSSLDSMIELYRQRMGEFPQDLSELIEGPSKSALSRKWGGEPMISENDLEDAWGHEFVYELFPKGSRPPYELYSTGSTGDAMLRSRVAQG